MLSPSTQAHNSGTLIFLIAKHFAKSFWLGLHYNDCCRGYLADPDRVAEERLVLAQKYGYDLPNIEEDPERKMLLLRKDPRQVFFGLEPGWVVSLKDRCILKPKDPTLRQYYNS